MTWVKVCGLTSREDVAAAILAGADAVGFVTIPSSPRFIAPEQAAILGEGARCHTVLLTLDLGPEEALALLRSTGLSGIQPYGDQAVATAVAAKAAGYLALLPQRAGSEVVLNPDAGIPLLDTPSGAALGGTGRTFDWSLVAPIRERFILAGGLGPHNVARAVSEVRPWGVDASSALERTPGQKDHGMVADFITKAKDT